VLSPDRSVSGDRHKTELSERCGENLARHVFAGRDVGEECRRPLARCRDEPDIRIDCARNRRRNADSGLRYEILRMIATNGAATICRRLSSSRQTATTILETLANRTIGNGCSWAGLW